MSTHPVKFALKTVFFHVFTGYFETNERGMKIGYGYVDQSEVLP